MIMVAAEVTDQVSSPVEGRLLITDDLFAPPGPASVLAARALNGVGQRRKDSSRYNTNTSRLRGLRFEIKKKKQEHLFYRNGIQI